MSRYDHKIETSLEKKKIEMKMKKINDKKKEFKKRMKNKGQESKRPSEIIIHLRTIQRKQDIK